MANSFSSHLKSLNLTENKKGIIMKSKTVTIFDIKTNGCKHALSLLAVKDIIKHLVDKLSLPLSEYDIAVAAYDLRHDGKVSLTDEYVMSLSETV